jgi:divinyl protochlorophyllide a 8-vinyl-reductase
VSVGVIRPNGTAAAAMPAGAVPVGRIGPNAITRVHEALREDLGVAGTADLFREAGLDAYLQALPEQMVDEHEVICLHQALRTRLGPEHAVRVARVAGRRTGDYLLANRIPRAAQHILRLLPPALASRVLLAAIGRHSWTFAGTGAFVVARSGRPVRMSIAGCPICRGARSSDHICDYYTSTFERLFQKLVSARAVVRETEC